MVDDRTVARMLYNRLSDALDFDMPFLMNEDELTWFLYRLRLIMVEPDEVVVSGSREE